MNNHGLFLCLKNTFNSLHSPILSLGHGQRFMFEERRRKVDLCNRILKVTFHIKSLNCIDCLLLIEKDKRSKSNKVIRENCDCRPKFMEINNEQ